MKIQIVIDVEREDGPLMDEHLQFACNLAGGMVEMSDAEDGAGARGHIAGVEGFGMWSYSVREVPT